MLLQTLPSYAYDTEKTLEHARAYSREFARVGISKDRFCLKVPCTGAGLAACAILKNEGIRTLATAVFSVHQAIAASQAGCLYISPYYNGKSIFGICAQKRNLLIETQNSPHTATRNFGPSPMIRLYCTRCRRG